MKVCLRHILRMGCLTWGANLVLASLTAAKSDPEVTRVDCGAVALYNLLRLSGRAMSINELVNNPPPRVGPGRSMGDLQKIAARNDLRLEGMQFELEKTQLTTPAIAYLRPGEHGHFVVIRPVGHTGRLVQVLDSTGDPFVIERDLLVQMRGWTGILLVPSRGLDALSTAGLVLIVVAAGNLAWSRLQWHGGGDAASF